VQNSIQANSIYGNAGLGIDLGIPPANFGQNAPVLTSLSMTPSGAVINGSLTSSRGLYRIEFFSSPVNGPIFQGQTFLGFTYVTVPASGSVTFTATGLAPAGGSPPFGGIMALRAHGTIPMPTGVVTATATNLTSGLMYLDTSAFSQAVTPTLAVSASISTNPVGGMQTIALTALVSSGGTPLNTGEVTFSIEPAGGGVPIGTLVAGVSNGIAEISFVIPAGAVLGLYEIVADYEDNSGFFPDATALINTATVLAPNRRGQA